MTEILFCGDPHGNFQELLRVALERRPQAVILLGDIQARQPLHEELAPIQDKVWFIHGNHDTDSEQDFVNLFDSGLARRNLHGRVVTLDDGTRVAGLGGVFRKSVWFPPQEANFSRPADHARSTPRHDRWREGPHLRHWSSIYPAVIDDLAELRADILVTHEAPSCHPHGFKVIDDLARAMRVRAVFHGHHHDRRDYSAQFETMGFEAFGVGLCGITDQMGCPIVPGELDYSRRESPRVAPQGELDDEWDAAESNSGSKT